MPADHSLSVRKAVIEKLKADVGVSALVGARIVHEPDAGIVWPFIRYGLPVTESFEASGWSGSDHDVTLHAFAKGPGTDAASVLAAAIVTALDDAELPLAIGLVGIDWLGTDIIRDTDEKDAYHAVIRFAATTTST